MTDPLPAIDQRLPASGQVARIGQIWYDATSREALDPAFTPIHNPALSRYFEASVIREAVAGGWATGADLIGIFSWRFGRKIPLTGEAVLQRLDSAPGHDVYSFFGALPPGPVWSLAERKHPGILRAAELLFDRLGLPLQTADVVAPPVYQHHFIARTPTYGAFVRELLGPALDAMGRDDDVELQSALRVDSAYRDARLTPARVERVFGTTWLPLYPFVAERLFSTWLALHPDLSVHPLWRGRFVTPADLEHEPELQGSRP